MAYLPEWNPVPCTITRVVYDPFSGPESSYEKHRELSLTVATGMMVKKIEKPRGVESKIWYPFFHTGPPYSAATALP